MLIRDLEASEIKRKCISPWLKFWAKMWVLTDDCYLKFSTEDYHFKLTLLKGFKTDGRSGPFVINPLAPKWGGHWYDWAILAHDASYNDVDGLGFDFDEAQDMFKQILDRSLHEDKSTMMKYFTTRFSKEDWLQVSEFDKENQEFIVCGRINWAEFGDL